MSEHVCYLRVSICVFIHASVEFYDFFVCRLFGDGSFQSFVLACLLERRDAAADGRDWLKGGRDGWRGVGRSFGGQESTECGAW